MAKVFMSYSHADEAMRDRLETHLAQLKREGVVEIWHDRRLLAGARLDGGIMAEVEAADVFLFLVSADFLASEYCYTVEMGRALEREAAEQATVIPVVLHSCEWKRSPLGKFLGVPRDGKPIAKHPYMEDAYLEVTEAIRTAVSARGASSRTTAARARPSGSASGGNDSRPVTAEAHPRSSNLAIRKTFTDADRHAFLEEGFEFIARFFEESLSELQRRNPGVEGRFRRNRADAFSARAFVGGKQEAQCRVMLGGMFGKDISFAYDADARMGSSNEQLSVRADDQGLMFDALMSGIHGRERKGMSQQGAAEHLWGMFIQSLQDGRQ